MLVQCARICKLVKNFFLSPFERKGKGQSSSLFKFLSLSVDAFPTND